MSAARELSQNIVDYPFPAVDPYWNADKVKSEAVKIFNDILAKYPNEQLVVHVAGEFTMCYTLVNLFKNAGVKCVASCTFRNVVECKDGTKIQKFGFIQFREY